MSCRLIRVRGYRSEQYGPRGLPLVLKPEQVGASVAAETKIRAAMTKAGYAGPMRWYQLVSGGETPQFLLFADRADWAGHEQPVEEKLDSMMEKMYGKDQAARLMRVGRSAVSSQHVETWQYRADLSFVPAAKQ
jgi:hypothetical protein